ncbi:MAG: RagB/SusD family nutrient uptake outer membrane protein [Pedobacter sp.]|nr:MAG: RagB/SusD family nutrient uptake outer membrane protein [Pedobacter sp.]
MKNTYSLYIMLFSLLLVSCKKDWLDRESKSLILDEQVWNDPKQITSLLANFYDRLPTDIGMQDINDGADGRLAQWRNMADYDEGMWSGQSNNDGRNNIVSYPTNRWFLWNYSLIRDINLTLEKMETFGTALNPDVKTQFNAELRFIRAFNYFELVKRMGGVPLITNQLIYDYSGEASSLRNPRNKEAEVYDFIYAELEAIKTSLGNVNGATASNSRANRYTALALQSRAMLYAASIAKYNALITPSLVTAGEEVGIPAARANEYYRKSLDASMELINSGVFALSVNPGNPAQAFYEAVTKKSGNKEVIFVKDFLTSKDKRHVFSYDNIARGIREDNLSSSSVSPSLNLVESSDFLDGTPGSLKTRTPDDSDFIYYDNPGDIFLNKDGRMGGTVLYPGSSFKGSTIEMLAGVMIWNGSSYQTVEGSQLGSVWGGSAYPNGDGRLLTGSSGPHRSIQEVSNTGFYLRKYIDDVNLSSTRGVRSDVWWVWIRLGEIYMNAAEAAFELGEESNALMYINKLRERAGFPPNSLTSLTLDKIATERWVELAFEDHRLWDLIRWRKAHTTWTGTNTPSSVVYALYPYRIVRPGDAARDGKYVFVKMPAPRFRAPRFFQLQNYYTFIPQNIINNNPLIVRNPLQ